MTVGPGEIACLVGRNGAGKTTLLRTIIGQLVPSSGAISWLGEEIAGFPSYEIPRRGIGFSAEESEVFADLTVEQNVAFGTWTRTTKKSAVEREAFAYSVFPKLGQCLGRGGTQLSGGERKMVSIARAGA
jgi:branched-chain amino acid transport system ATP-binding protein